MKQCFTLLTLLLLALQTLAQAPAQFSYQAVIRDNLGSPVKDKEVQIRVSILQNSESGPAVYVEQHKPKTNENGLVTLAIGGGTRVSGEFTKIKWEEGSFFLKTEIDPDANDNISNIITATSRLLTVPYAIYAQRSDSTRHAVYADSVKGHQIGDLYAGGIIFSLWRDHKGVQHGLIASLDDLGTSAFASTSVGSRGADDHRNGAANTATIVRVLGTSNSAAGLCTAYESGGYTDWYLPSSLELQLLYQQSIAINMVLSNDNNDKSNGLNAEAYWSSTVGEEDRENRSGRAFRLKQDDDEVVPSALDLMAQSEVESVRAIRQF